MHASLWDVMTSNPVGAVASPRPLGMGLAWVTTHLTSGIWLQQLVNVAFTVAAWGVACLACRNRVTFAWIAFIVGAVYFTGYIYLFHLHGVFYGPLLLFISFLLWHEEAHSDLSAKSVTALLAATVAAAMFHSFALVIAVLYVAGLFFECKADRRFVSWWTLALAGLATVTVGWLVLGDTGLGSGERAITETVRGWRVSFDLLDNNVLSTGVSLALTVAAGVGVAFTSRGRIFGGAAACAFGLGLRLIGWPPVLAWAALCILLAIASKRYGLALLLVATGALPLATGTGSPTYALLVILPCTFATATALTDPPRVVGLIGSVVAIVLSVALLGLLRTGVELPVVSKAVEPLLAEQEKTQQLSSAITWLTNHPSVSGELQLCERAGDPSKSTNALNRTYRPPTDAQYLSSFLSHKFGDRLASGAPIYLCFGGQQISGAAVIYSDRRQHAGAATISLGSP